MRYTGRDSSSLAPANIWREPAISSSWPFGNASSRMRCGGGIGGLYQPIVVTRRPKTGHFGPTDRAGANPLVALFSHKPVRWSPLPAEPDMRWLRADSEFDPERTAGRPKSCTEQVLT